MFSVIVAVTSLIGLYFSAWKIARTGGLLWWATTVALYLLAVEALEWVALTTNQVPNEGWEAYLVMVLAPVSAAGLIVLLGLIGGNNK